MRLQMRKKLFVTTLSLAVLFVCIGVTNALAKPMINNIRFESPTTTADRIIFELNGPYLPTGKALPGDKPRVYFDFPNTTPSNKVKTRMSTNGNFVKQIRYAYHKGAKAKTRVVFDLIANQKMEFKQDFDQNTNTLVISLYLAGTKPKPVAVVPPHEPEPVVIEKPTQPEIPLKNIGKKVQPIEDVSIIVDKKTEEIIPEPESLVPPQAHEFTPVPPKPAVQEASATVARPEPESVPEPAPQNQMSTVSNIPPTTKVPDSLETPIEETTIIQPMSEVGTQEETSIDAPPPVLHSIEFDQESNRGEIISFKLNGFQPPVVFGIEEDIPRIVCFFKNTSSGDELRDMIETNGQYVRSIKVGKYKNPDNIRAVLELVPGYNYDLQQVFFKDEMIFMMIINKAGKKIPIQTN